MRLFARRLFLVGALLAALVMSIAPPLAVADDDDGGRGGGGGDRAFCAPAGPPDPGQCSFVSGDFDFEASSGPLGENPMGMWRLDSLAFFYEAEITCLQVTGNRASFGGRITASSVPSLVGLGVAFTALDNTPVGPDLMDTGIILATAPPANTPNCGDPPQPMVPVDGDIVVQDNIAGACPPGDDDDGDGLTNSNESVFFTLLGNADSDLDGIADGNDDANGNGEDDEDEDDDEDENNGCSDEDSDGDGEDDEDEDDDDD